MISQDSAVAPTLLHKSKTLQILHIFQSKCPAQPPQSGRTATMRLFWVLWSDKPNSEKLYLSFFFFFLVAIFRFPLRPKYLIEYVHYHSGIVQDITMKLCNDVEISHQHILS